MTDQNLPVRVRIAPSPTGDPHVGTAYIGLLNYIYAKQRAGKFVLRIEDTDRARFVATSEQEIFDSLHWLGLTWDEGPDIGGPHGPYRQSERTEIYREHVKILLANGTAYKSFETAEELEALRKSQLAAKLPPRYNGAHRELTPEQIAAFEAEGRPAVIRLKVPAEGETSFRDELRGDVKFSHNNVDDQVLMKSDGFPTYHLANVVDDHLMRITDVIRAEEWISSTPKHVLLYKAFGWDLPRFWHMPLLRNLDKSKISKRKNPVSLIYYRQAGFLPAAVLNFLGLMGGGMPANTEKNTQNEIFTLPRMLEEFEFDKISLGGPVFDLTKLKWLNGEYLRALSADDFFAQIRENVFSDSYLRAIAPLVQTRIETLAQFGDLADFFFKDDVAPTNDTLPQNKGIDEIVAFTSTILGLLETTDWKMPDIEATLRKRSVPIDQAFIDSHDNESTRDTYRSALKFFRTHVTELPTHNLSNINDRHVTAMQEALENEGKAEQTIKSYSSAINELLKYAKVHPTWPVKENFMLLRAILTGRTTSPPLIESLIVFGKARSLDRIRRFLDALKKTKK
jgi:glutamyl-tRNA synthetase